MNNGNLQVNDSVIISGDLTGYGVLEGHIIEIEPFFGRKLITAKYNSDSIIKADGKTEVQGYEEFFALKYNPPFNSEGEIV